MVKRIATGLWLLGLTLTLAGCNTITGMGRDLAAVGHAIGRVIQ